MMQPFLIKVKETYYITMQMVNNQSLSPGYRNYLRDKMYFLQFFYYNIWHESHRYNQNLPINIVARDANQSSRDYFVRLHNKFLSALLKRNTFCVANNSGALARGTHSHQPVNRLSVWGKKQQGKGSSPLDQRPVDRLHSHWLFTICMSRPVGPRFRKMVRKNSGLVNFGPESRLPYVQIKSVRFTGKRPRRPETGIKLMA